MEKQLSPPDFLARSLSIAETEAELGSFHLWIVRAFGQCGNLEDSFRSELASAGESEIFLLVVDNGKADQTLERAQTPLSQQSLETLLGPVFSDGRGLHDFDNGLHSAT